MLLWSIIIAGVYLFISACLTAYVASEKGRDGTAWFFIGLVSFGLSLLAVVGLPVRERVHTEETEDERRRRIAGERSARHQTTL